jgi:hypothetical protein
MSEEGRSAGSRVAGERNADRRRGSGPPRTAGQPALTPTPPAVHAATAAPGKVGRRQVASLVLTAGVAGPIADQDHEGRPDRDQPGPERELEVAGAGVGQRATGLL